MGHTYGPTLTSTLATLDDVMTSPETVSPMETILPGKMIFTISGIASGGRIGTAGAVGIGLALGDGEDDGEGDGDGGGGVHG